MALELLVREVKDVRFGAATEMVKDTLVISYEELRGLLEEDHRFERVDLFLVHPGEEARIINVSEVIEPRYRTDGVNFPGVLGPVETVGEGQTLVLRGVAVVETNPYVGSFLHNKGVIDMSGSGASLTPYSQTHNVVLSCRAKEGIAEFEYAWAIKQASLKAAAYLAQALQNREADYVETYDLPPATRICRGLEDLPRIGYLQQLISLQFLFDGDPYSLREPFVYGASPRGLLPIVMHPNEILDGALMAGYSRGNYYSLYSLQNSAIIKELYQRHGKDLCFVGGCLIVISPTNINEKERIAAMAARLARSVLGLDGIILAKEWAGASETDQALQCEAMEATGIKTVVMSRGYSANYKVDNYVSILTSCEDAIVSCGNGGDLVSLSGMANVYGGDHFQIGETSFDPRMNLRVRLANIVDAISLTGFSPVTTQVY